ncbi:MAG: UTRA domain-containing protein, partial [Acetobacteraceae bacterium]
PPAPRSPDTMTITPANAARIASKVRLLRFQHLRPTVAVARRLCVGGAGRTVLFVQRIRAAGDVPIALDERSIVREVAVRAGLTPDTAIGSIIDRLWLAGPLREAEWTIEARLASAAEAALLQVSVEMPVLVRSMSYVSRTGATVLIGQSVHRADLIRFSLRLPLRPPRRGGIPTAESDVSLEIAG